jgi:molybdate transport repressor ModE-like protein
MSVVELDLRRLEIFARVVQEGGITQAARSLGLTQPTVSGHIHSLEEETGAVLLHRGGGRARPTAAGDLLHKFAAQICTIKEEAKVELEKLLGLRQGELKIGASTTPATYFLPPILADYSGDHPAIRVDLIVGDTRDVLAALDEGRIEIAVVGDEVDADRYRARKVATDRLALVVGRAHPFFGKAKIRLEELRGQPLVAREEGSATLSAVEHILAEKGIRIGAEIPVALRLPTNEAIREAVARGKAAAFLPKTCLVGRDGDLKAVEIEGIALERPFMLVVARDPSPAAKALMKRFE